MGRGLLLIALLVLVTGALLGVAQRVSFLSWLGRLPGDFRIRTSRGWWYFPLASSVVLSLLLSLFLKSLRFLVR